MISVPRPRRVPWILLLVLVALAGRLAFSALVLGFDAPMRGDEPDYHALASNLADGHGYAKHVGIPTAQRPPLYPLFLSGVYAVFGKSLTAGRLAQIVLGVLLVPLVYALARRVLSPGAARLAAGLVAVDPYLIFLSAYLMTENLYLLLLTTSALVFSVAVEEGFSSRRRVLAGGILIGLVTLARPTGLLLAGFAALAAWIWGRGGIRGRIAATALLALGLAVVVAPWAARNQARLGAPVLSSTHGGVTFYQGNNAVILEEPFFRGGVTEPRSLMPGWDRIETLGEVEGDREAMRQGLRFLREHPGDIPRLCWWKFRRLWRFQSDMGMSGVRSGFWWGRDSFLGSLASTLDVGLCFNAILLPSFVAGLWLARRRLRAFWFPYAVIAMHTAVALAFFGSIRYRLPMEPFVILFAALALATLAARLRRRRAQAS